MHSRSFSASHHLGMPEILLKGRHKIASNAAINSVPTITASIYTIFEEIIILRVSISSHVQLIYGARLRSLVEKTLAC